MSCGRQCSRCVLPDNFRLLVQTDGREAGHSSCNSVVYHCGCPRQDSEELNICHSWSPLRKSILSGRIAKTWHVILVCDAAASGSMSSVHSPVKIRPRERRIQRFHNWICQCWDGMRHMQYTMRLPWRTTIVWTKQEAQINQNKEFTLDDQVELGHTVFQLSVLEMLTSPIYTLISGANPLERSMTLFCGSCTIFRSPYTIW